MGYIWKIMLTIEIPVDMPNSTQNYPLVPNLSAFLGLIRVIHEIFDIKKTFNFQFFSMIIHNSEGISRFRKQQRILVKILLNFANLTDT